MYNFGNNFDKWANELMSGWMNELVNEWANE